MNNPPVLPIGGEQNGLFIVIEGTDGSGKSTQYIKLKSRLVECGLDVLDIHFPRYNHESSYFVRQYLSGEYGTANDVNPYKSSIFYALDRYHASQEINQALSQGKIVLCDRYIGSNMAHQGTKFSSDEERRGYFVWLDNLEYTTLNIPRPDLNFILNLPIEVITERLKNRKVLKNDSNSDVHEDDLTHIAKSIEVYKDLSNLFPKDFIRIDGVRENTVLAIDDVHRMIWEKVKPLLPNITESKDTNSEKLLQKSVDGFLITEQGQQFLENTVTNTTGNVYAFTGKLSPITIAAAMARLSRRGDDMRITILDEFAGKIDKDKNLLKRVITAFGDDSVQQLVGQHIVVENASNLLTKKLEWGRLAAYLEQSTRYIYFDKKNSEGNYKYHVPTTLDKETKQIYKESLDKIFDLYSVIVHKLTDYITESSSTPKNERDSAWKSSVRAQACDAARPLLPVATTATVGIFASGQALESLIMHLLADDLKEAKDVGEKLLFEARKTISTFLERADKPDRGGAIIAYKSNTYSSMKALTDKHVNNLHSNDIKDAELTNYWPKNELELVPDMLYEHTNLSLSELKQQTENLSYEDREEIYKTYMGERLNRRQRPGRALEKAHFSWDLVCDYGIFRDLQRHRMVDDMNWQQLTPRFGYEIPKLIEEAGLTDLFEQCFDISLSIYSILQFKKYELEAQYSTLLGHKMRWKVTYNLREAFHLHELRTSPQGHPGYRKLVNIMHQKLAEVYPIAANSMIFVNMDEDPELSRLAAERYTKFKLLRLEDNQ